MALRPPSNSSASFITDTFEPHRVWRFSRTVPEFDAKEGFSLYEVGPGSRDWGFDRKPHWDGNRFQVREGLGGDADAVRNIEEFTVDRQQLRTSDLRHNIKLEMGPSSPAAAIDAP